MLRRFLVEREIPGIGGRSAEGLGETARTANVALDKLSGIQWQCSFVAQNKTFCIFLADSEAVIREHGRLSGFPVNRITEIPTIVDPASERHCAILAKSA